MRQLIMILLATACALQTKAQPLIENVFSRDNVSLNGVWNYIVDPQQVGYYDYRHKALKHGFFENRKPRTQTDLVEYDFDKSPTMNIPTDWNTADDQLFFYEGTVWFKRSFSFNKQEGKKTLLYFGAVNYTCIVFMNGVRLGKHEGGFTPFNFDVSDVIRNGNNDVVLMVDNSRSQDNIPTLIFDWWNYGGITRDVMLISVDDTYISNYSFTLDRSDRKTIYASVQLNSAKAGVIVNLKIDELKINKRCVTDDKGCAVFKVKAKPQLWEPENPKLYDICLTQGNEMLTDKIGFRTIEAKGKQILLNGKPVFLRGVSIHDETAIHSGRISTDEEAQTLLTWAKEMGCNYVRLAHYPHNERMVRMAERMGIMVWSEIPVYWTISWNNSTTLNNARCQLRDMITRDRNRANVIIWSIANETPHSEARDNFLANLATYARQLDTTRLISMAMEVTSSKNYVNKLQDNMNKYVDVVSFNEYVGWYRDVSDTQKMTWLIPYDKPVIVSEFGGGAVAGNHGDKKQMWTEEFQAELYRQNLSMLTKIDGLAGLSPWILKDFRSSRRPLYGTQNYFNRKGLVSDQGVKKQAYWVMKEFYDNKEYEKK